MKTFVYKKINGISANEDGEGIIRMQDIEGAYQPNVLIRYTVPTRATNTFTFPALGYEALINNVSYTNPVLFSTTIADATTNYKRTDLIYIGINGVIGKVQGTESLTVAVRPDLPVDSVGVAFINVFGTTISDPTTINDTISIQDVFGTEKFSVDDYLRFNGVSFNPAQKLISVDSQLPLSAFLDPVNGDDITGALENSKKPFKTFKALQSALPEYAGETYTIYITGGTVPITRRIQSRNINWVAYTPLTLDFSNCMLDDGTTPAKYCIVQTSYGGTAIATWDFKNSNISVYMNFNAPRHLSYDDNNSFLRVLGTIDTLNLQTATQDGYQPCFILGTNSNLIVNKLYNSVYNSIYPFGATGNCNILIREYFVQYVNKSVLSSEQINYLTIDKISQIGSTSLTFNYALTNLNNNLTIGDINFNVGGTIKFGGNQLVLKSSLNSNVLIDFINTKIISGTVESINYPTISYAAGNYEFRNYTGKLDNIALYGTSVLVTFSNCNITTSGILARSFSTSNNALTIISLKGFNSIVQIDTTQNLFYARAEFEDSIINITDSGTVKTNAQSYGVRVNYVNTTSTFKEKMNEIVIRSKVDLVNKVLSSIVTYIIDGQLTLLTGEYINVPVNGLTIVGYGFNVSSISKNVSGQSIFKSVSGGSGDVMIKDIVYNSGSGSVFDLLDSNGSHAIEINDVNFQSCASLGIINGYRQFTGTTCGLYSCLDGLTLDGSWSGFKMSNSNIIGFGASGTLFKKGATMLFSNRFYIDLNLSLATGAKLADFLPANFSSNELFQINNTLLKVNGVIDAAVNTPLVLPNITANNAKARWTNSLGINLTAMTFTDLKSATKIWRLTIDDSGVITTTEI